MTDRELMQQALDALEYPGPSWPEARHDVAKALRAALAAEQEPQYKLICPTCKADRTKVDCQGNRMNCGLKFEAFGVQPDIQPAAWAIYAIPSSDNPIDVTMDAEVLDEIANPVKPLYTAPSQREIEETIPEAEIYDPKWCVDYCKSYAEQLRDKTRANRAEHAAECIEYLLSVVQKEWVGLTDEEREEATGWSVEHIESALKTKNA